ncbi:hypothetical protein PG984_010563 [Apiospora sp. TS-2023a]
MDAPQEYPSFELLRAQRQPPKLSMDMLRIRWRPFGPLEESIQVADNARSPPSPQSPAYHPGTTPASPHPVSASPLTEPAISSITVTQDDLNNWEDDWVDEHIPHADDDDAGTSTWVDGSGDDEDDEDGLGRKLVRCCDQSRPRAPAPLVVGPSTQPYLTVDDYIVAVHAWLRTHRDSILAARGVHEDGPVPASTSFYVNFLGLNTITLDDGKRSSDFDYLWQSWAAHVDARLAGQGLAASAAGFVYE